MNRTSLGPNLKATLDISMAISNLAKRFCPDTALDILSESLDQGVAPEGLLDIMLQQENTHLRAHDILTLLCKKEGLLPIFDRYVGYDASQSSTTRFEFERKKEIEQEKREEENGARFRARQKNPDKAKSEGTDEPLAKIFRSTLDEMHDTTVRMHKLIESEENYSFFLPGILLKPILEETFGHTNPGTIVGEYLNTLFDVKSERIEEENSGDRYVAICLAVLYSRATIADSPHKRILEQLLDRDTQSVPTSAYLAYMATLPSTGYYIFADFMHDMYPDISCVEEALCAVVIPMLRSHFDSKYCEEVKMYLVTEWEKWARSESWGEVLEGIPRLGAIPPYNELHAIDPSIEIRGALKMLNKDGAHGNWVMWNGEKSLGDVDVALYEAYGYGLFVEIQRYFTEQRRLNLGSRFPVLPWDAAEFYSRWTFEWNCSGSDLDISFLFAGCIFGSTMEDAISPIINRGNSPDRHTAGAFRKYYSTLIDATLDEKHPVIANSLLALQVLMIYRFEVPHIVDWLTLARQIEVGQKSPGSSFLQRAIDVVCEAGWQDKGDEGRMLFLLLKQYKSGDDVSKGDVLSLRAFSNPTREVTVERFISNLGDSDWSKLSQRSREFLIAAELQYLTLMPYQSWDNLEWGNIAGQYFKVFEYELTERVGPLLADEEALNAFIDNGFIKPNGPLTAGSVIFGIFNKYETLSDIGKQYILAAGIDISKKPEIWRPIKKLLNQRNSAFHTSSFDEQKLVEFRTRVLGKGLLKDFIAILG